MHGMPGTRAGRRRSQVPSFLPGLTWPWCRGRGHGRRRASPTTPRPPARAARSARCVCVCVGVGGWRGGRGARAQAKAWAESSHVPQQGACTPAGRRRGGQSTASPCRAPWAAQRQQGFAPHAARERILQACLAAWPAPARKGWGRAAEARSGAQRKASPPPPTPHPPTHPPPQRPPEQRRLLHPGVVGAELLHLGAQPLKLGPLQQPQRRLVQQRHLPGGEKVEGRAERQGL